MLGAGLPVVTTSGTEIAAWIGTTRSGEVVPPRDPKAFADALVASSRQRDLFERRARRARTKARACFRPAETLGPFLEWAAGPVHAPDRSPAVTRPRAADNPRRLEAHQWARLKVEGQVQPLLVDRASLANLRAKLPLRLWRRVKTLLGKGL
jgi:hypothetical protein